MLQKIFISLLGLTTGAIIAYFVQTSDFQKPEIENIQPSSHPTISTKTIIGFLPFWLIPEATNDYSKYLNEITYFNLTISEDGSILKYTNPRELDPGWNSLQKGRFNSQGLKSSVALFLGSDEKIEKLLENPTQSAQNLVTDITPLLDEYGFSGINIDIEKVKDSNIDERTRFIEFVKEFRKLIDPKILISIDVTASSFVKETNLVSPNEIKEHVNQIIVMAYDYHHPASGVTGPVAPLGGAGTISEYDVETAIQNALIVIPKEKIILGIPLYGYSWETINEATRSATIPRSYITYSNKKAENLLGNYDEIDAEMYSVVFDEISKTYRQTFYPTEKSTLEKIKLAQKYDLGGIALWALGYEGETILTPLSGYLN